MNLGPVACNGKPSERKRCGEIPSYREPKSDRRKRYEEETATKQKNHEANTFVWQGLLFGDIGVALFLAAALFVDVGASLTAAGAALIFDMQI